MSKIIWPKPPLKEEPKPEPQLSEVPFGEMLERCRLILEREIRSLTLESSTGKLSKDSAQSLRDYVKLLTDLSEKEQEVVNEISEEKLKELIK